MLLVVATAIYNLGKQKWHIKLKASLEANNDILLHQNLWYNWYEYKYLPGAIGFILEAGGKIKVAHCKAKVLHKISWLFVASHNNQMPSIIAPVNVLLLTFTKWNVTSF